MKSKLAAVLAGLVACVAFAGCASTGSQPHLVIQPQQLITDFCPSVNAQLKLLTQPAAAALLNPTQQALVEQILTVNTAVCTANGEIDANDLQTLNATLFPALITLVASIPAIPNQPAILIGLMAAQPVLSQVLTLIAQQQAAAAGTPASAPVVAPDPASGAVA
ncbi:hypothetical protein G3N58_17480 [Paraburkholderia sp. Ac-20342]|uniref:hypothetical protein n=1 Tax=Paraburkholderia sp. Ac-20342 TaxID=2703889 RepID=UPI00198067CD|nr:hypothetical protein [Paraburkholderia sp. Ac-20342]MBN3848600.1 hypothetical protein [Paraburkholderia sp. Ac-20342]